MFSLLHIENVAVIESAEIAFGRGMNALTGETGAGKSIIIDSIGALLGSRIRRDLVRTGAEKAVVSGIFTFETAPEGLAALGVECEEGELYLQRDITVDGKGTARINGRPVPASLLRSVGQLLINIHGQHDSQLLLDESTHLGFIDRFGGCGEAKERYQGIYRQLLALEGELRTLRMDEEEKARQTDLLQYQIHQLEAANLKIGEDDALEARKKILQSAQRLQEAAAGADRCLSGTDETSGAVQLVQQAARLLMGCADCGEKFEKLADALAEASYTLEDLAGQVADMTFAANEQELDAIETRLDAIDKLRRRYGATIEAMLERLEANRQTLEKMEHADERLDELRRQKKQLLGELQKAGLELRRQREQAAALMEEKIGAELAYLDMPKARFYAGLTPLEKPGREGLDRAAFQIAVNTGEAPGPLAKVASGGELSRVMLAMQNVLTGADGVDTLIFDEVDAGLSGRAAGKVAEKLATLSQTRQILCVTHLAQLGAMADRQFRIFKQEAEGRTFTTVAPLDDAGRAQELARIVSGDHITPAALDNVRDLMENARRYKAAL